MFKKVELSYLIIAVLFFTVGVLGVLGTIQEYVHFRDPLNEMAVIYLCFFGGAVFSMGVKK
jgi:hypothetical protein